MTKSTRNTGIAIVACMVLMLMVATLSFVRFDNAGILGLSIGIGLGLVNMAISYKLTTATMKDPTKGMESALTVLLGGFFARLLLLVVLILLFQRTPAVDAAGFAMGFMILFFANMAIELMSLSRTWNGNGGTA